MCSGGDTSSLETQYIYDLPLCTRRLRHVSVLLNRNYNAKEYILHGVQPTSPATYSQFQGVNAFILLKAVAAFPVNLQTVSIPHSLYSGITRTLKKKKLGYFGK